MIRLKASILLFIISICSYAQMKCIRTEISHILKAKKLEAGIALYDFQTGDTLSFNGNKRFPMQSVYKFPIALATLNKVDEGYLNLSDSIFIPGSLLQNRLWSPIREKYPQGNIRLPLSEIITYTVALSDNNGSDLLMEMAGGPDSVHTYIAGLNIKKISIRNYEKDMQADWNIQFNNYATPLDIIELLKKFKAKEILKRDTHDFLWTVMENTSTGSFKKKIPQFLKVIHKTGNSGFNSEGVSAATNDVGILVLPDERAIAFALFISNSTESNDTNYEVISDIAKAIYDCYNSANNSRTNENLVLSR